MAKRNFIIKYRFDPAPDGSLFELQTARLVVKASSVANAMKIGHKWLGECWYFYKVSIRPEKKEKP
jgi:hypothetical protein